MATALYVILTVFVLVLVAVVGLVVVQHLVPPDRREGQNDVAGFIYAVLGVAYAVLLAFVVFAVWQDYKLLLSTLVDMNFLERWLGELRRTP